MLMRKVLSSHSYDRRGVERNPTVPEDGHHSIDPVQVDVKEPEKQPQVMSLPLVRLLA
jgi:hypothetical protein